MEKTYFAECINEYEKGRPPYDKKIFETIVSFAGLDKNGCCLEIGAGPGTATAYMEEYKVDALEITREQVSYFNKKYENYENINMYQCSFEEYSIEKKYDLIYSATAWHWLDQNVAYDKAAEMLNDGGVLALFWQKTFLVESEDKIVRGLQNLIRRYIKTPIAGEGPKGDMNTVMRYTQLINASGRFSEPVIYVFEQKIKCDYEKCISWIISLSNVENKENMLVLKEKIKDYFETHGGSISVPTKEVLILTKKNDKKMIEFVEKKEILEQIVSMEELAERPLLLENHFMNYGDNVIYIVNHVGTVVALSTPTNIIEFYEHKRKNKYNRNFLYATSYKEAIWLMRERKVTEIPIIENDEFVGIVKSQKRKTPFQWKKVRETLSTLMQENVLKEVSLVDLFNSLSQKEQVNILRTQFDDKYLKLFLEDLN